MRSPPRVGAGDFNGNPPGGQELFNRLAAEIEQDNSKMAVDDDNDGDEEDEEEDDDGEEEDEEECSNGSPADEDQSNNSHLNEEWHSGTRSLAVYFSPYNSPPSLFPCKFHVACRKILLFRVQFVFKKLLCDKRLIFVN